MKRIVIFVILVFSVFGLIFAQTSYGNVWQYPDTQYNNIVPGPSRVIVSGILGISRGMITLTDRNGVVWYITGLDRYIGFINGLDIGKRAELEGYAPAAPDSSQERFFQVTKLRLDGMDYELTPLPTGIQITAPQPPKEEPIQPLASPPTKVWEHNHTSPWMPKNGLEWMQSLDMNAIWKDDTNSRRNKYRDDPSGGNGFF
ncbi:hypothetical protein FACS1894109_20450 [Spirochaetia bacterium]|nr:hypothetical protein FACS1894109_20450 [Spirochaetia bacterium]